MNPVDNGTINPDPAPSKALTAISCHIRSESKYNTPLAANIPNPICNSRMLFTRSVYVPERSMNGIINKEGNEVSI